MLQQQRLARPLLAAVRGLCASSESGAGAEAGAQGIAPFPAWLPASHAGVKPARLAVPLSRPLPGVSSPGRYTESPAPPPTEVTRLDNGATIISEASPVRRVRAVVLCLLLWRAHARLHTRRLGGCRRLARCVLNHANLGRLPHETHAHINPPPPLNNPTTHTNQRLARRRAGRSTSTAAAGGSGSRASAAAARCSSAGRSAPRRTATALR